MSSSSDNKLGTVAIPCRYNKSPITMNDPILTSITKLRQISMQLFSNPSLYLAALLVDHPFAFLQLLVVFINRHCKLGIALHLFQSIRRCNFGCSSLLAS